MRCCHRGPKGDLEQGSRETGSSSSSRRDRSLTLQNGLGNEELLAALFGAERVLGGLCFVCLTRRTTASVDHFGHGMLSIGEYAGSPLTRTRVLVEAFCKSDIDARVVDDLATERWRKLVWNIPFNGLAVAESGLTVDKILGDPKIKARCRALMNETIAAATALGHPIEQQYADLQIERTYPWALISPPRSSIGSPEGNWKSRQCGESLCVAQKKSGSRSRTSICFTSISSGFNLHRRKHLRRPGSVRTRTALLRRENRPP